MLKSWWLWHINAASACLTISTVFCSTALHQISMICWSTKLWWHGEILYLCDQPCRWVISLTPTIAVLQIPVSYFHVVVSFFSILSCIFSGECFLSAGSNKTVNGSGMSGCLLSQCHMMQCPCHYSLNLSALQHLAPQPAVPGCHHLSTLITEWQNSTIFKICLKALRIFISVLSNSTYLRW